ncbi:MAG: hypothetical protein HDR39_03010 [Treponema sp.]|nr:hypothetical protein [Treponema sp.]
MIFPGMKKIRDKFDLKDDGLFVRGVVRNSSIRLCDGHNCKILSITAPTEISEAVSKALQKFSEKPFKANIEIDGNVAIFTFREYVWPYSWKKIGEVIEGAAKIIYDEHPGLPASEEAASGEGTEKEAVGMGYGIAKIAKSCLTVIVALGLFLGKEWSHVRFASDFARSANADCPRQLDEWTRLDSVSSRWFKIYLNYTVYGIDLESQDAERIKEMFIENLRASVDAAELSNISVWFVINYADSDGNEIFQVTIFPADYR